MSLSRIRRRAKLTQAEAAQHLGVSVRTLQEWEQGRAEGPALALAERLLSVIISVQRAPPRK